MDLFLSSQSLRTLGPFNVVGRLLHYFPPVSHRYKVKSESGPDLKVNMSLWKIPVSFHQLFFTGDQSSHI